MNIRRLVMALTGMLIATSASFADDMKWTDVTVQYVKNPAFDDDSQAGWTWESNASTQSVRVNCISFYNGYFNLHQQLLLPKGHYRLKVQGFYRTGENNTAYNGHQNGSENITARLYAGEAEKKLVSIYSDAMNHNAAGRCWEKDGKFYPDGKEAAEVAFDEGRYWNELEFDDINKGEQPIEQIHVYNNGTSLMHPNLMHLPSWLSATTAPEEIRPGRTATITVTLNSQQVSDYGLTQSSIYLAANLGDKATQENLIGVSAVLLPAFQKMTEQQKQYAPKLYLSKEQVNIVFDGKSKKKDEIQLSNIGHTTLTISSLQMFTAGLKIALGKSTLRPGESTKLKITAERDELKKVRTKPRILMITNDPDKSKVIITINSK